MSAGVVVLDPRVAGKDAKAREKIDAALETRFRPRRRSAGPRGTVERWFANMMLNQVFNIAAPGSELDKGIPAQAVLN